MHIKDRNSVKLIQWKIIKKKETLSLKLIVRVRSYSSY